MSLAVPPSKGTRRDAPLQLDILWLQERWDEPPTALHSHGVDDGSEWGAPPFTPRFQRWIGSGAMDKVSHETQSECEHRFSEGKRDGCTDCGGYGVKRVLTERYRTAMRAALFLLRKHVHMTGVHYADALYRLRVMDWNVQATCAAIGMNETAGEAFLLEAIRLLRTKYSEQPIGRPRRISESQSIAEAAAA